MENACARRDCIMQRVRVAFWRAANQQLSGQICKEKDEP